MYVTYHFCNINQLYLQWTKIKTFEEGVLRECVIMQSSPTINQCSNLYICVERDKMLIRVSSKQPVVDSASLAILPMKLVLKLVVLFTIRTCCKVETFKWRTLKSRKASFQTKVT